MSNHVKYRKDFLDELEVSIVNAVTQQRDRNPNRRYEMREIRSKLAKLYDDLYHDPQLAIADVISRLYRVRDIIILETWDFEPLLSGSTRNLMQELDVHYRDAETVRDICNSIRRTSGHLSS